ncbi:RNA-directed DNA polymerase, eukaryota [Artemisia annua]|uniref:RNA-directed DNA polymerase, eukaryota n=1 Tax=Artemisia annua TaxID=35608 RepID=A0A2U1MGS6_ARTAN|nr:RNA-directed DNA polymerase, eukaryota [Artemisia annua]
MEGASVLRFCFSRGPTKVVWEMSNSFMELLIRRDLSYRFEESSLMASGVPLRTQLRIPSKIILKLVFNIRNMIGKGFDFFSFCKKRVGDGVCTRFWSDVWILDVPLRDNFPRLFALETDKDASVAVKLGAGSIASSFRREVRDGAERHQWSVLISIVDSVFLSSSKDRRICDLSGDGEFKVKVVHNFLDDMFLPSISVATRWLKCIPLKINIFVWRARRDSLPARYDLSRRGVVLDSVLCPICGAAVEDIQHVLFRCELAQSILRKVFRWWDLGWQEISSFSDWEAWFLSFRLSPAIKSLLEVSTPRVVYEYALAFASGA